MLIHMYVLIAILHPSTCANLTYYIEENKSSGTFIGDIANDIDAKDTTFNSSSIVFSQVKSWRTDSERLFRISKHEGKLYTAQILDAESLCSYDAECFQILDVALYQLTTLLGFLEIKVIIQDVNDHPPEFPVGQVSVEFSEGNRRGTRKAIPNAVDRDVGYFNSQMKYSLRKIHDEPFMLLVSNGFHRTQHHISLILQGTLDREIKDNYLLQVVAEDGGSPPLENILDIQISVSDVNDNSPVFTQKIYNVSAYNKPDSIIPVTVISAKDSDLGHNGEIVYRFMSKTLVSAKSYFKLDPKSGKIFLKKKVATKDSHVYKLYVEARDKGNPPLSAVTKVIVRLVNKKNTAPVVDVKFVFASAGNIVNISEDVKVGSVIAYITARDEDAGQNGEIHCYLHHDVFRLQNLGTKKYKVVLKSILDRETISNHNITVTCRDSGSPPLKSKQRFSVHVIDVNDMPPQFSQDWFRFWIHENQKPDFPVGFINATDPDFGCEVSYSLLASNGQFLPFKISRKGFISTVSSLDRESKGIYKFRVLARDNGDPSLNNTVNVIVKVRDENDNAPYFTFPSVNPYNMDVTYYPHHTKNISQIKASDSDSQENAFLKYEIIRGNSKQIFSINQYTGLLCSTHVLSQQDAGSYELEFLVKDSGSPVLSARTTVYLTLTVSNKTSEMLNAVNIKKDNKIHLTSAIVIVSVAVTMAVIITASISVCILRCCNPRSVPVAEGGYVSSGQRHLISPPYPANPWSNVALPTSDAVDMRRSSQPPTPRMQTHPYSSNQQMLSSQAPKPQPAPDTVSRMYIQDIALPPGSNRNKKRMERTQDYSNRSSAKSSVNDNGQGWSDVETRPTEDMSDIYRSQYCNSSPSQSEQQQTTEMKPLEQTVSYPSDTTIVARGFYTPYMNENSPHTDANSNSASNRQLQSRNVPTSGSQSSINRPLPPVPT